MNFVIVDDQTIRNELLAVFETETGIALLEGDARRIFLEQFAVPLVAQYNAINSAGKQNLLQYAYGGYLDAIGARWGDLGVRLPAQKATVTLLFTLSAIQSFDVIIQKGTRATTADNSLFFSIIEDLTISVGATTGSVTAEAMEGGEGSNGFAPGLVNRIVDPIAYVASVSNTSTSVGGADIETDDNYRARLIIVSSAPSTAGSIESYTFWALKTDSTIADISVTSPSAGAVTVTALLAGGLEPNIAMLTRIRNMLEPYRPLTDSLTVQAPGEVVYTIGFTYYINTADSSQVATIQAAITTAVNDYIVWQYAKLGRDINPDELRKRVLVAGASRMTITTPTLATVALNQYARNTTVALVYGGLD